MMVEVRGLLAGALFATSDDEAGEVGCASKIGWVAMRDKQSLFAPKVLQVWPVTVEESLTRGAL
jgi:hypothetical protein